MEKLCRVCNIVGFHYMNGNRSRNMCKNCWREYNGKYRKVYVKRHPEMVLKWMHTFNFGGLRERVLKRDNYKCTKCYLTREEHFIEYGSDITIHHIDGNGYSKLKAEKNNTLTNLVTLCRSCHGKLHGGKNRKGLLV